MRPTIHNPDEVLSAEPMTAAASQLQANSTGLPVTTERQPNGLFSKRHRLPVDCKSLAAEMEAIREQLTGAVAERHGEVGIHHAALIDSVLTHHKRLRLLERWLVHPRHSRQKAWEAEDESNTTDGIDLEVRIKLLKEEASATDARSKAILALGLGKSGAGDLPWDAVFAGMAKAANVINANKSSEGT